MHLLVFRGNKEYWSDDSIFYMLAQWERKSFLDHILIEGKERIYLENAQGA